MRHLEKSTLAAPSISFHCCAGKSTLIFSYQLHAIIWTSEPPKIEIFCVREIRLFVNMFTFDEEELLSCALGERVSKKESCSQKPIWWMGLGLSFLTISHFSKVWCGEQCGVSNMAHLGIWARSLGFADHAGFFNLHISSLPLPLWCSTIL